MRKNLLIGLMLLAGMSSVSAQVVDGRDFGIDGFAAIEGTPGTNHYLAGGTTGGEGGKVVLATNFTELQAYLQAKDPYIILVKNDISPTIVAYVDASSSGKLCDKQDGSEGVPVTYGERIRVASNKTLIGINTPRGEAPLFSRITFVMQCTNNVIIRNCQFTMNGVPVLKSGENKIVAWRSGAQKEVGDPDCIGIQADLNSAKTDFGGHIWVDHCTFFNGDADNKDRYDGLLDCKNNVQWMTFSYNHFMHHDKACLFGKGDSDVFDGCRTISYHHNYLDNIEGSRLPLQRGGNLHYCNNFMDNCQDGWDLRSKSVGYGEACYFQNSKAPILSDGGGSVNLNTEEDYKIIYKGCKRLLDGYTNIDGSKIDKTLPAATGDWVPTQTVAEYQLNQIDKTEDVPEIVQKYSGAGKIEIWTTYASSIPEVDMAELDKAIKNQAVTEGVYDADGNKITSAPTSVNSVKGNVGIVDTMYYGVDGSRLEEPQVGVNVVKSTTESGEVKTAKVVVK